MTEPEHFDRAKSDVIAWLLNQLIQQRAENHALAEQVPPDEPAAEGNPDG